MDKYIKSHPKRTTLIKLVMSVVSIVLLMLIICDYIIIDPIPQITTAINCVKPLPTHPRLDLNRLISNDSMRTTVWELE